jgi:3-hydroxybutyryl-CoA dehydratase
MIKTTGRVTLGSTAAMTRTVTAEDLEAFARITGDTNPAHFDDQFARACRFDGRVAHGMLVAGHISAVLGTMLPGPGSIYLNQTLSFKAPVYIGDIVTTTVTVIHVRDDKPVITLRTSCTNHRGELVIEGEAAILLRQPRS